MHCDWYSALDCSLFLSADSALRGRLPKVLKQLQNGKNSRGIEIPPSKEKRAGGGANNLGQTNKGKSEEVCGRWPIKRNLKPFCSNFSKLANHQKVDEKHTHEYVVTRSLGVPQGAEFLVERPFGCLDLVLCALRPLRPCGTFWWRTNQQGDSKSWMRLDWKLNWTYVHIKHPVRRYPCPWLVRSTDQA